MLIRTIRRFTVCVVCCLCCLFVVQQGLAAERPLHEAAKRGLLPSGDADLVAGVVMYSVAEGITADKKTGFTHEKYVFETSEAVALLILPRYADSTIKLYELSYDEKKDFEPARAKVPMYSMALRGDKVFWLYMNIPDTMPRLRACLESGGKEYCFTPYISGKDGSLMLEDGFVELDPIP